MATCPAVRRDLDEDVGLGDVKRVIGNLHGMGDVVMWAKSMLTLEQNSVRHLGSSLNFFSTARRSAALVDPMMNGLRAVRVPVTRAWNHTSSA